MKRYSLLALLLLLWAWVNACDEGSRWDQLEQAVQQP